MKNTIFYIITILISMFFSSMITYLVMTKKQMNAVFHAQKISISNKHQHNNTQDSAKNILAKNLTHDVIRNDSNVDKKINDQLITMSNNSENNDVNINDYSETQAKELVADMPDYVLGQYVDKFMAAGAQDAIQDKRQFAERAIEELYKPNDSQPLDGTANISFSYVMPKQSSDTSKVDKFAKMYAHLDTHGKIPAHQHIFIKWVNNQTGQVLLFEKKNISIDNTKNWVSFVPTDGWQTGSYDVRFYQFTSELQPIAQTTYDIYEVVDKNP